LTILLIFTPFLLKEFAEFYNWILCNFVRNCSLCLTDVVQEIVVSIAKLCGLGGPRI